MSSTTVDETPQFCAIDQCATPFDVHCFHCRTNMCSHHYFEHQQQRQQQTLTSENDQDMVDLLQLTSSKYFSISHGITPVVKIRRTFSNPFVSSRYLMKKMRRQAARRTEKISPDTISTVTTPATVYNLRKRPEKRLRTIVAKKTTNTVKVCRTVLKTSLKNDKLCNRKLPCPYHPTE